MIEQKYQKPGLLSEKKNASIFPRMSDLVLVFFPTPGVYVKDNLSIPESFNSLPVDFYTESYEKFDNIYSFIPAVRIEDYQGSGLAYSDNTLFFETELIEHLSTQLPEVIEHRIN